MLIGYNLPLSGSTASPAMLARLAAEGDAIGYDYVAISDHIVEPTDIHARYPNTESGEFPAGSRGERHEQLTAIAYLAAKTSRLKVPDLRDGGAASARRAHGKDPRHHRRDVRRAAHYRGGRWLA